MRTSEPVKADPSADGRFAETVNSARNAFRSSLCEHALMDTASLDRVLTAFDSAVATIADAVLTRAEDASGKPPMKCPALSLAAKEALRDSPSATIAVTTDGELVTDDHFAVLATFVRVVSWPRYVQRPSTQDIATVHVVGREG